MRHVYVTISSRIAAGEVAPGDFHFTPAWVQGAVKLPWHRPARVPCPTCTWGAHAEVSSFCPFTNECPEHLC